MQLFYYINLDERGEFFADVRDCLGQTVMEIHGFDIFEDGFMSHANDINGLLEYMIDLGICPKYATLETGN